LFTVWAAAEFYVRTLGFGISDYVLGRVEFRVPGVLDDDAREALAFLTVHANARQSQCPLGRAETDRDGEALRADPWVFACRGLAGAGRRRLGRTYLGKGRMRWTVPTGRPLWQPW